MFKTFVLSCIFTLLPLLGWAQLRISEKDNDVLLLQISTGYLSVIKEGRIELDSNLIDASQRQGLSRIPIITEGIGDIGPLSGYRWMDSQDMQTPERKLPSLKGKDHARLSLLIGACYTFHAGLDKKYIDKAIFYLTQAQKECTVLNLLQWSAHCNILLGKCHLKANDLDAAKASFKIVTDDAAHLNDKKLVAKAWNYEGTYCPFQPATTLFRIECLEKAEALYKELDDHVNEVNTLTNISYLRFAAGKLKESETAANESYQLQKTIGFPYVHYIEDLLALIVRLNGNYSLELKLALSSVEHAERTKDSMGLSHFYARVADSYIQNDNHVTESNFWYKKSLDEFVKHKGDPGLYRIFSSDKFVESGLGGGKAVLALIQQLLKDYPPSNTIDQQDAYTAIAACYEGMHEYTNAEKYFLMAETLEKPNIQIRGNISSRYIYHRLGFFYLHAGDYKKSMQYSLKFISDPDKVFMDSLTLASTYWALFQADSALGNFPKMEYLYKYTQLNNTFYTTTKNRQLEELNVRYKTLQKQKDLQMYKEKNLAQQRQAATVRRFSLAGLGFLILIIVMILLGYFNKQKSNRILRSQKDEIDRKNIQLQQVIQEKDDLLVSKEWLLKEVHHRVKNNLQLVMSLLNSQTTYLKDEVALNAVMESRHRVQAMSLIHQKLYKSDNASNIDMREYILQLVDYLKDSFKTKLSVYFDLRLEPIQLDVSQAIPVGLILNEIITNALKYAFPHTDDDVITISFQQLSSDQIALTVADNGKGLPENFDISKSNSFGMLLIKGLTEDLDGTFTMESKQGTVIKMVFAISEFSPKETAGTATS